MASSREERIVRNETIFREVNERVAEVNPHPADGTIEFLCECGDETCTEVISLSHGEYERLRSDPLTFGVKPGHVIPDVEDIVAKAERFHTVRKHEEEAPIARATDPRG